MEPVVLGWVDPGEVSARFMRSVLHWIWAQERDVASGKESTYRLVGHIRIESGPRIAPARNTIVRTFLNDEKFKDLEWLLMVDADMTFPDDFLERIFNDVRNAEGKVKRPIVGGLYFGGGHDAIFPCAYRFVDPKTNGGEISQYVTDFTPGEIVEVDACGTGALLMHRDTLEYLATLHAEPTPWFAESQYKPEGAEQAQEFGEDYTFCMRLRHQEIPIFVNTGAVAGHMKMVELNETMWRTGLHGLNNVAPAPAVTRQMRRRSERQRA
jgi:hypothetical protein